MAEDQSRVPGIASDPPTVAVIGGGIAGVLLSLSIAKHAPQLLPVTLYESASKFGEIGAGVAFGPNAIRAMEQIGEGVRRGFDACSTANGDPAKEQTYFEFREGMDRPNESRRAGELITEVLKGNEISGMVHRASFLDEMVALLPDSIHVKFKKRLVDIEEPNDSSANGRRKLKFADGSEAWHSAVIGCDGIKSRTRIILLGPDDPASHAVFTGKYCYRGLIPMDEAIEAVGKHLATNSQMYLGYHGHMLTFPVQKGKTMNVVAFASTPEWTSKDWVIHADREKMYRDFESWSDSVKHILRLMQKPDIWALFNHLPARSYYRGRLCLIGDAAHASSPHQGSGASMAVEDALVMGMMLKNVQQEGDFEAAFAAFDALRRPRTQKLVWTSKECGQLYDFELSGTDGNIDKVAPNIEERHWWIWNKYLEEDIVEGNRLFNERRKS